MLIDQDVSDISITSLRTGRKVGTAISPIINISSLKIEGWHSADSISKEYKVVPASYIREISPPHGIIVDDHEAMTDLEDLIRMKDVIEEDVELNGMKVYTDLERYVGKIVSYAIDNSNFEVCKLHVSTPIYKSLNASIVIIDRKSIIESSAKRIVVTDSDIKIKSVVQSLLKTPDRLSSQTS